MLFNKPGVAVNAFVDKIEEYQSRGLYLKDVEMNNTKSKIREIVVLNRIVGGKLKPVVDTAGSVLQIDKITDQYGHYKYTILSDYKIVLGKIVSEIPKQYQRRFGTLFIPKELYDWRHCKEPISKFIRYGNTEGDYIRSRNSDAMNHQNRGVVALRIDGVEGISISNLQIKGVENMGRPGSYDVYYTGSKDGGHSAQSGYEPNIGYMGADVRAIGLYAVKNFRLSTMTIEDLKSLYGKSIAVEVEGTSSDGAIVDTSVHRISAYTKSDLKRGPSRNANVPIGCGFKVGSRAKTVGLYNVRVEDVTGGSPWVKTIKYSIHNNDTRIQTGSHISTDSVWDKKAKLGGFSTLWVIVIVVVILLVFWFMYASGSKKGEIERDSVEEEKL